MQQAITETDRMDEISLRLLKLRMAVEESQYDNDRQYTTTEKRRNF